MTHILYIYRSCIDLILYVIYIFHHLPHPKKTWMFRNSHLEVWAKLMTDAAWYDKGLILECKGAFGICSYAGVAVDSFMYCIICMIYAMMIY